jgi:hypothetical protein
MKKVVVIRVGSHVNHSWEKKWSSPDMPFYINNQTVLDLFVEQHPIIVVFVSTGDIPLYTAAVQTVRPRDNLLDSDYPLGSVQGLYKTFITFERKYPISNDAKAILQTMLNSIKYVPGQQVVINDNQSLSAVILHSLNSVNLGNPILNTTYINPAYF